MMGFGFGGFGLLFMIVFWVLIFGLAVWLINRLFPQVTGRSSQLTGSGRSETAPSPEEILKQRYAQGEISTSEFEAMRQQLR